MFRFLLTHRYWILGLLLIAAGIAVVRRAPGPPPSTAPPSDLRPGDHETPPGATPRRPTGETADRSGDDPLLLTAIEGLEARTAVEWRPVRLLHTPWGRDVRLRPFHRGVEIRGVDARLVGEGRIILEEPHADWSVLRREAERLEGYIAGGNQGHGSRDVLSFGALNSLWTTAPSAVLLVSGDSTVFAADGLVEDATRLPLELDSTLPLDPGDPPAEATVPPAVPVRAIIDRHTGALAALVDLRQGATGSAHIFDPHPIAASGRDDLRDGDPVEAYRVWVALDRLEDGGRLRGQWVETRTDLGPAALEPFRIYDYVSTDPRFEQAMAYAHGDRSLQRAVELGYTGLVTSPLRMRVHGTRLDNSWYSPLEREVVLGSGGVDDAEDADIILHETGHALHDALVPGFGGGDTRAISEGFSDFWAASRTDDPCVGDWDATSYGPPCLRRVDDDVRYPHSLSGNAHRDGRVFSALLWDLRGELGVDEGERLALAALIEQSWDCTWEEAAAALLRAADRLGIARDRIEPHLARRGFRAELMSVELGTNDVRRVELPGPMAALGQTALALDVSGQGEIRFVDTRLPEPGASPWVVPFAPSDRSEVRLRASAEIHGSAIRVQFRWIDAREETVLRAELEWNTEDGRLHFGLRDVSPALAASTARATLWSGASDGSGGISVGIDPEASSEELWSGFAGFRLEHAAPPGAHLGESYELRAIAGTGLELERISVGRDLAGIRPRLFARPSPFATATRLDLYAPAAGAFELSVHGSDGRLLRRLEPRAVERGVSGWWWDGRDAEGREVPAGRYWIRARGEGSTTSISVVRLR